MIKVKKIIALVLTVLMCFSMVACSEGTSNPGTTPPPASNGDSKEGTATTEGSSKPQKTLKLGGIFALDTAGGMAAEYFCDIVEEYTNGEIVVNHYPSEQLGTEQEMVESVNMGALDFTFPSASICGLFSQKLLIFPLPYVVDDWDHLEAIMSGDIGKDFVEGIENATDMKVVASNWFREPRFLYANKPVYTPDDLDGVRIRVPENVTYVKGWARLGASPTPMALSEVYTAIQTGALDAAETTMASYMKNGTYSVAPYLMMTEHVYESNILLTNEKMFNSLTEFQQEAIMRAGHDAGIKHQEIVKSIMEEEIEFFKSEGVTIVDINRDEWTSRMDGLADEIWEVWGDKDLYHKIRALANDN